MRTASIVELLVYPYFEKSTPPPNKSSSWIYSAKTLPKDGLFIVVSTANNFNETKQFVEFKLKPILNDRCILVSKEELNKLPQIISKIGFKVDEKKTEWRNFGFHKYWCPANVNADIVRIFGFNHRTVRSVHAASKSVDFPFVMKNEVRRKILERDAKRAARRLHKPP